MIEPAYATLASAQPRLRSRTLHWVNGDVAAAKLRLTALPGTIAVYADVLYEGPAPPHLSPQRWRRTRARYLAECGYEGYEQSLARLAAWDRAIDGVRDFEEVVLWFEPDLFDQLLLLRLLYRLADEAPGFTSVSLVSSTEPGSPRFTAFGSLAPQRMATLAAGRARLGPAAFGLAREAWEAFTAPTPAGLEELLERDTTALPFLAAALLRHLEEFPALANGLSRTEQQVLVATAEAGRPILFDDLFRNVQALEERPFMTDLSLLRLLRLLAAGPRPLLRLETVRHGPTNNLAVSLQGAGDKVLAGREDWVDLAGVDRWLGGVHLEGTEAAWRWDAAGSRLVRRR
jgi:hypothetical protein